MDEANAGPVFQTVESLLTFPCWGRGTTSVVDEANTDPVFQTVESLLTFPCWGRGTALAVDEANKVCTILR